MRMITREHFVARVGRAPVFDDLERCNCDQCGKFGHYYCGWNWFFDLPQFMIGPQGDPDMYHPPSNA